MLKLAEVILKGWRIPAKPTTPEGRNVTLFYAAMRWFGRPSNWEASTDLGDLLTAGLTAVLGVAALRP